MAVFIIESNNPEISALVSILSDAVPSNEFNIDSILLSKVIYLSIINPLFKSSNLTFSTFLLFVKSEKHTLILPDSTAKGITLFCLATSKDI